MAVTLSGLLHEQRDECDVLRVVQSQVAAPADLADLVRLGRRVLHLERDPVIGGHHHQRLVVEAGLAQLRCQLPEQRVRVLELEKVALLGLLGKERVVERLVAVEAGLGSEPPS